MQLSRVCYAAVLLSTLTLVMCSSIAFWDHGHGYCLLDHSFHLVKLVEACVNCRTVPTVFCFCL
jgi:hypothetical protein